MINTSARRFGEFIVPLGSNVTLTVDGCLFDGGGTGSLAAPLGLIDARNSTFRNLAVVFDLERSSTSRSLVVRANRFENVGTVVTTRSNTNDFAARYDLAGNDFAGATAVLGPIASGTVDFDFTNSFFGATDPAAIEAKINDNRADADLNDTIKGKSDYTGFLLAPPTLTAP
jgi:hypothetical protein